MSDKTTNEIAIVEQIKGLPTLAGFKEKALQAVTAFPFTKIEDAATSKTARANRTGLVKARTELTGQQKTINKKLAEVRDAVKGEIEILIEVTRPHEERQQVEIDAYDEIKKEEKRRKELAEEKRVELIKSRISDTEAAAVESISDMLIETGLGIQRDLDDILSAGKKTGEEDFDFMEFEVLYEDMESRMISAFNLRVSALALEEKTRLEDLEKSQKAQVDAVYRDCTELLFAEGFTVADIRSNFNVILEEADNFDFGTQKELYLSTKGNIIKQFKTREVQLQEAEKMQQREARMQELEKLQTFKTTVESGIGNITLDNELKYTKSVRAMLENPSLDTDLIVPEYEAFLKIADKKMASRKKEIEKEQDALNVKAEKEQERIDKRTAERRAALRVLGLEPTDNGLHFVGSGASIKIESIREADDTVFAEHKKVAEETITNFKKNDATAKRESKKLDADKVVLQGWINNADLNFTSILKLKSSEGKALANDIEQEFRLWLSNTKVVIDNVK